MEAHFSQNLLIVNGAVTDVSFCNRTTALQRKMDPETTSWKPVHRAGDFHHENQADTVHSMCPLQSLGQNTSGMDIVAVSTYLAAESGTHVQQSPQLLMYSNSQHVSDLEEDEIETDCSGRTSSRFPSPLPPKGDLCFSHKINALPYSSNRADQLQHKV